MRFSVLGLIALLSLSGCADKGAFDLFTMDKAHERSVEQLRTGSIVLSLETKAIISAIYLNPVYPEQYKDGEFFIAAIYFENDMRSVKKRDLKDIGYRLTLNGKEPVEIEELKEADVRRQLMPVRNTWNRFYLVKYHNFTEGVLALGLENNLTGKVVLNYQKGK
ncbi:MAG: hypothetical protein Q8N01_07170 [Sulfuricurvum sp.]|nr:hypothetical protein [Sulfuricurvum sp.]MDP3021800.1 hypothetical protein [Sulfuricurvum sp.]MDP3120177.1 hypothetical protein [Sulfuricurvum sp.]